MNLTQAVSLLNECTMNYEEKVGEGSTAPRDVSWEDVAGFIATLPSQGQQSLVMYALQGDNATKRRCADQVLREVGGERYRWQDFKQAQAEVDCVVNGVAKTEVACDSELMMKVHSKLAEWEADFLFRLGRDI